MAIDVCDLYSKLRSNGSSVRRSIVKSRSPFEIRIAKSCVLDRKALLLVTVIGHRAKILYPALNH
jgi:hypothetical protein